MKTLDKRYTERLIIRLSESLLKSLKKSADALGMRLSEYVRARLNEKGKV